jgi:N-acetylmuramoyl-L-alanine amidase
VTGLAAVAVSCLLQVAASGVEPSAPILAPTIPRTTTVLAPGDRDALVRVAYAEAGNQGDSGLAGVVFTILNRLAAGGWGDTVGAVVDAPGQFEPVMRAGGNWRRLSSPSAVQRAHVETIINLALEGRLPDLTHGARYFQNPRIVAARAAKGQVSTALVGFGGATPSAVIGAHAFYVAPRGRSLDVRRSVRVADDSLFVGVNRAQQTRPALAESAGADVRGAIFVGPDGAAVDP